MAKKRKAYTCPSCGSDTDADVSLDTEPEDPPIVAGDYTICLECGKWLRFKKVKRHLEPELITDSEVLNFKGTI
jgi:predicted transcriptional regulator